MLTWCFTSKLPRDIAVLQPRTRRSPRLLFRADSAASTSSQQGRTTHGTRQRRETVPTMTNQGAGPWLELGPSKLCAQVPNHLIPNLFIFNVMHKALARRTPRPSLSSSPSIHPPTLSAPSTLWTTEDTARKRKSYRQVEASRWCPSVWKPNSLGLNLWLLSWKLPWKVLLLHKCAYIQNNNTTNHQW